MKSKAQLEISLTLTNGTADTGSELSQEEIYQLIREGISYYDSLLDSGSVDFIMQTYSALKPARGIRGATGDTWNGTFEFSGNRLRGSVSKNSTQYDNGESSQLSSTEEFAYDGETFERLWNRHDGYLLERKSDVSYNTFHDPRWWGWNMRGQGTFTDLFDSLDVKNIQSVEMNDIELYHVTGTLHGASTFETWINPEKNYRPERFMSSNPIRGESQLRVIRDFNFREVAPDLWFPESGQSTQPLLMQQGRKRLFKFKRCVFPTLELMNTCPYLALT